MTDHGHPRVLVVDDEELIADSLAMILSLSGFAALAAYSGEMAIQMARSCRPDIVVTDVAMPGINGIDTAIKLREMFPTCKALLFSGHATTEQLLAAARARDQDFELIPKPVHPAELLARLRSVTAAD